MRSNDSFAHAHEPGTQAVCPDALSTDARALKEKVQFVREHFRLAQSGGSGELDEPHPLRGLELLDDAARGVAFVRQFDCSIGQRAAALIDAGSRHLTARRPGS